MVPWSQYNFPWSGDIVQSFDIEQFFDAINTGAGDEKNETEIISNKAPYGGQRPLPEMVRIDPEKNILLKKLTAIHAEVEEIKARTKANIQKNARLFLSKLKENDNEAFKKLLNEYKE